MEARPEAITAIIKMAERLLGWKKQKCTEKCRNCTFSIY
jgi:hypothetical protein